MEDITNKEAVCRRFGNGIKPIVSVLANYDFTKIIVGDYTNQIFQYNYDETFKKWKYDHIYAHVYIDEIMSITKFGNIFFCGGKNSLIFIIDVSKNKIILEPFVSAVKKIFSLQVCIISKSLSFLSVVGTMPSYNDHKSDLFDLRDLMKMSLDPNNENSDYRNIFRTQLKRHIVENYEEEEEEKQEEKVDLYEKIKRSKLFKIFKTKKSWEMDLLKNNEIIENQEMKIICLMEKNQKLIQDAIKTENQIEELNSIVKALNENEENNVFKNLDIENDFSCPISLSKFSKIF